jgi:hypothetical protein
VGGGNEGGDREHWRGEVDGVGTGSLELTNKTGNLGGLDIPTQNTYRICHPALSFDLTKANTFLVFQIHDILRSDPALFVDGFLETNKNNSFYKVFC